MYKFPFKIKMSCENTSRTHGMNMATPANLNCVDEFSRFHFGGRRITTLGLTSRVEDGPFSVFVFVDIDS